VRSLTNTEINGVQERLRLKVVDDPEARLR
jgi:hypothetical protein